jgi:phosphopantetheinyl transferase
VSGTPHLRAAVTGAARERGWSLPRPERRRCAATAIRSALYACGATSPEWTYETDGGPRAADPRVRLSVSHCDDTLVVLGVRADCAGCHRALHGVGVDLERAGAVPAAAVHLVRSARRTARTRDAFRDPTALFAAKEAVFKAQRVAHRFVPRRIDLTPTAPLRAETGGPDGRTSVRLRRLGPYWLALSVARADGHRA